MQTDSTSTTTVPVSGASVIPELGMTFADASTRAAKLIAEQNALAGRGDSVANAHRDRLEVEWTDLLGAILGTEPVTMADGVAILDRLLCPFTGLSSGTDFETQALQRVRDLFAKHVGQQDDTARGHVLDQLRRWLELENAEPNEQAAEESFALARKIAAYDGAPALGMAAKAILLWVEHEDAHDATKPGAFRRPPAVAAAISEHDALIFGLVHDALRAVPELAGLIDGAQGAQPQDTSTAFIDAIDSLADRALPHDIDAMTTAFEAEATGDAVPFGVAVEAFEGAAEQALCMPTAPTLAMLEAGAAVGGIDLEQARAIYAAMAVAFAKEVA